MIRLPTMLERRGDVSLVPAWPGVTIENTASSFYYGWNDTMTSIRPEFPIKAGFRVPTHQEQLSRQASWQSSSVSHTLGAVNSIRLSTCLFPIESGCVVVVRAH